MPIFEYQCLECSQPFEFFQLKGEAEVECPACGSRRVERQISLYGMSSDTSRAANLSAAHKRAAVKRSDKQRSEHQQHHEHFEDTATDGGPSD